MWFVYDDDDEEPVLYGPFHSRKAAEQFVQKRHIDAFTVIQPTGPPGYSVARLS